MSEIERPTPNSARLQAYYDRAPKELLDAAGRAVSALSNWTLTAREDNVLRAVRATRLLRFKDDVTVTVEPQETRKTRLELYSASRIGKSDLGQNPRNLRELTRAIDAELG